MKAYMQRMGRSLMLPVAVLPAASLLVGIANWIVGMGVSNAGTTFLMNAGLAILNHLALLFAVGLALGMSKDKDGSAALAGLVAYLVPQTVLASESVQGLLGLEKLSDVNPAFSTMDNNVFIGIIAGLTAAAMYNRFSQVKLPMALSFFSGKRLVPIMSALAMLIISAILLFIWPSVYDVLVAFGKGISRLGFVGAGLYGFFNRLLIPTGLHHALNSVFWFGVAGINDIGNFLAGQQALDSGQAIVGQTGMYQAGFFPVMMFGLPAGALAIYQCARPEKKKQTASLMLAAAFASFFTGVTEPLEFSFMFVAWPLYVLHAVFTGISLAVSAFFHWTAGFAFSAGFVDYFLSLKNPVANQPLMLLVQGAVFAVIYYFGFRFAIQKFNLMTPGREETAGEETPDIATGDDKFAVLATQIYQALGGKENVRVIDNCTTRLRLQVQDTDKVDQEKIKQTGVPGVKVIDKTNIQVVVGTQVQFVADEMSRLQQGGTNIGESVAKPMNVEEKEEKTNLPEEQLAVYAPSKGELIPISEVADPVFSEKMMGDGFAVLPEANEVFAPISGTILNVFPTKHAIGIQTDNGLEVLLHMGINTVDLKGEPFTLYVEEGQRIARGQLIAVVDLEMLEKAGKKSDMIVVFTNGAAVKELAIRSNALVQANEVVGQVKG
ncbi:N-acetylglucosamine-specific PTS transporter subunit IIBC [Enterococcus durans]|uniref:N-acetylglucosamine-specific PTS transporter subunit IIBC n=1 Tax=Enterococcus durans TaxID=53345 RepID=UPI00232C52AE|nr:N-acetylglucosamine-specific PTS transporter subunit IIBC [Enterococcus durans]MDB1652756.1 N-acetylglucosamine-specific PTS transporter subunit IIBC [Enterococcus durans]MDB1655541.1 N-acetylglucosamine-specific PTS transporter subunit IIBC [Enterococcus durans]MDB1664726.1 N-acetylglucosamine-specific PTS transporter subunit IIBC [Enterococcus durans]MDB1668742.1 N-acetylglucosamine-specific PTS transporter subunit IIBC [Enterococcus durans]MDB1671351.1 N-acetylglucosamine-specific PTS tr